MQIHARRGLRSDLQASQQPTDEGKLLPHVLESRA